MSVWYVLMIMEIEKEHLVYNALCRSKNIKEVHPLFGEWDLLVKLEGETEQIIETINNELKVEGVLTTKTLRGL